MTEKEEEEEMEEKEEEKEEKGRRENSCGRADQPKVVQEVLADLKRNAPVNVSSIVHHFQIQAVVVKIPENITLQNQAF